MQTVYYEKQKVFKEQIAPLIQQMKSICNLERMPMFISVAVENQPDKTIYCNDAVLASTGIRLEDNRIADIMLSLNGLETDYPDYIKKDLRELEEYMQRTCRFTREKVLEELDILDDMELVTDHFPDFCQIASGEKKAVLTDEMKGISFDSKYWEE